MLMLMLLMMVVVLIGMSLVFTLSQDLLACHPPALPVFLSEQRLVVPFGSFG
jgi:hypothetical protein